MIDPKTVSIKCQDGSEKEFIISKLPALLGREVVTQYIPTAMPKVGDYKANEELLLKLLSCVAVPVENGQLKLTTRALIDNHVPDFECLMRLEAAMFEYNVSFFQNGRALTFFGAIEGKAKEWITQTLTGLSGAVIGEGLATYKELKEEYSLEEALDLFEVVAVRRFNEWQAIEDAKQRR